MMSTSRFFYAVYVLLLSSTLFGQTSFPYSVRLESFDIPGLDGIHSYAPGQLAGKWVIIGGRSDGLHARQPFNAFPCLTTVNLPSLINDVVNEDDITADGYL